MKNSLSYIHIETLQIQNHSNIDKVNQNTSKTGHTFHCADRERGGSIPAVKLLKMEGNYMIKLFNLEELFKLATYFVTIEPERHR